MADNTCVCCGAVIPEGAQVCGACMTAGCSVTVHGELPQEEIKAYIDRATERYGRTPRGIDITVDGDYVDLRYDFGEPPPFMRLRRITGYLVGDTSRWNNGKRAELEDRVKHGVSV